MVADADANIAAAVDQALAEWRQGDCVLGEQWFVFRLALDAPLTPAARAAAEQGADLAEAEVRGLAVVSQTCDIVRSCAERPFVDVCPLVEVDEELLHQVERGRRPAYAVVPGLARVRLVADLDRTMALELHGSEVVTLVDDHLPVARDEVGDRVLAHEALDHRDVESTIG